jgi:hypothetical protein
LIKSKNVPPRPLNVQPVVRDGWVFDSFKIKRTGYPERVNIQNGGADEKVT